MNRIVRMLTFPRGFPMSFSCFLFSFVSQCSYLPCRVIFVVFIIIITVAAVFIIIIIILVVIIIVNNIIADVAINYFINNIKKKKN